MSEILRPKLLRAVLRWGNEHLHLLCSATVLHKQRGQPSHEEIIAWWVSVDISMRTHEHSLAYGGEIYPPQIWRMLYSFICMSQRRHKINPLLYYINFIVILYLICNLLVTIFIIRSRLFVYLFSFFHRISAGLACSESRPFHFMRRFEWTHRVLFLRLICSFRQTNIFRLHCGSTRLHSVHSS